MADSKAVIEASRQIVKHLADMQGSKDDPMTSQLIESFADACGGIDKLGRRLAEDFARVRGEGLTAEEQRLYKRSEQTIQKYYQLIWRGLAQNDELNASLGDLSEIDEDDLKATLTSLAKEIVDNDSEFRRKIAIEVIQEEPEILEELLKQVEVVNVQDIDSPS